MYKILFLLNVFSLQIKSLVNRFKFVSELSQNLNETQ